MTEITESRLDYSLQRWVEEYGLGGLPGEGSHNLLETLVAHRGFLPMTSPFLETQINTVGDEVEGGVREMESLPGFPGEPAILFRVAKVLRIHYFITSDVSEWDRLRLLNRMGIRMTRAEYRRSILLGRAFLIGWITGGAYCARQENVK